MCSPSPAQVILNVLLDQILEWLEPPELCRIAPVSHHFRQHVASILYRSITLSAPPLPESHVHYYGVSTYHASERRILQAPSFRYCQQLILPIERWSSRWMMTEGDCAACEECVGLPNLRSLIFVGGPFNDPPWDTDQPLLHQCSLFDSDHPVTVSFRGIDPRCIDSLPLKLRSARTRIHLTIPISVLDSIHHKFFSKAIGANCAEVADSREEPRFGGIDVVLVGPGELVKDRVADHTMATRRVDVFLSLASFLRRRSRARVTFAGTDAVTLADGLDGGMYDDLPHTLKDALEPYVSDSPDFMLCDEHKGETDTMLSRESRECGGW